MPNKRAKNQTLIAFACDCEMLRLMDEVRQGLGEDRSVFVRRSIVEELRRRRHRVNESWIHPPDRTRLIRYPPRLANHFELNKKSTKK